MSECRGPDCTHPGCKGDPHGDLSPAELRRRLADELRDPVVKYDGDGEPVRASQLGGNRAERRAAAREARRWR